MISSYNLYNKLKDLFPKDDLAIAIYKENNGPTGALVTLFDGTEVLVDRGNYELKPPEYYGKIVDEVGGDIYLVLRPDDTYAFAKSGTPVADGFGLYRKALVRGEGRDQPDGKVAAYYEEEPDKGFALDVPENYSAGGPEGREPVIVIDGGKWVFIEGGRIVGPAPTLPYLDVEV